jgi:hypothetical protein
MTSDEGRDRQSSSAVLMVRPASFAFNPEAAASNVFARASGDADIAARALAEFDRLAERLDARGVEAVILEDSPAPPKPDAVFPNNWVSFHADGTMVLYPMATAARRLEREPERVRDLLAGRGFDVRRIVDLSVHERHGRFLEGTGSLVLDRPGRRAYACLGPRTDREAIADFDARLGYSTFMFDAVDPAGRPIYHTNVVMSLGTRFAAICFDAVPPAQHQALRDDIEASGRTIVELSFDQLRRFSCNLIELENRGGQTLIAVSATGRARLRPDQVRRLEELGGELVDADITTIERVGGGGLRCMIADIHLPRTGGTVSRAA